MTPEDIKAALVARGVTLSEIGRSLRPPVSHKSVSVNVRQLPGQKSTRIRKAIARRLGKSLEEVFGEAA